MCVFLFPCIVCDANMNVHMNLSSDASSSCFTNVSLLSSKCDSCPSTCSMISSSLSSSNDNVDDKNDHYFGKTSCKLGDSLHYFNVLHNNGIEMRIGICFNTTTYYGGQGHDKHKYYANLLNMQTLMSSSFNNIEIIFFYVVLMHYYIMLSSTEEEDKNDHKDCYMFMIQCFRSYIQQSHDKFMSSKDADRVFASHRIIECSSS